MMPVAPPVPRDELERELFAADPLAHARMGDALIFDRTANDAPLLMREVARLRELTFRAIGSGTQTPFDRDALDDAPRSPYRQLVVYSPSEREVVGGCRYKRALDENDPLASESLFEPSPRFLREVRPWLIDIGRMFIQPRFQAASGGRTARYALDNLWDALGAVGCASPDLRYFFGRIVTPPDQRPEVRDLVQLYLAKHFAGDGLLLPRRPMPFATDKEELAPILEGDDDAAADLRKVIRFARSRDDQVSPLLRAYIRLSPSMRVFGCAADPDLSGIEETCLLVSIADIHANKAKRYGAAAPKNEVVARLRQQHGLGAST
jgi:hypothetical protein